MDFKKRAITYLLFCLFVLTLVLFVRADYFANTYSGANNFTFNEDMSNLYNITINNTYSDINSNISQINITFPSSFSIALETNGTNSNSTFSNISNTLVWDNLEGIILNSTNQSFWINASASTPGNYNISITLSNASEVSYYNISVFVNDIFGPLINNVSNYSITRSLIIINWTTNISANYTLRYNDNAVYNSSYVLNYSVTLTNLTSAKIYTYNITSCDSNNNCNTSVNYLFTTLSYASNSSYINYVDASSKVYNITINNSESDPNANITEINITLPSGINFTSSSNGTNAEATFSNSSLLSLSFRNDAGIVLNDSLKNIWFSARANENHNGSYIIILTITNSYGIGRSNITIRINDTTAPVINTTVLTAGSIDVDSASITWTTNEAANSTVYYDASSNPTSSDHISSENPLVTSHSVSLTGLSEDTLYYYEVRNCDGNGNCATSNSDKSFTTDTSSSTDSDGGSTGGGDTSSSFWSDTMSYSDKELSLRGNINVSLIKGERIRIKVDGTRYYVGVIKLTSSSTTINVSDSDDLWLSDKYSKGDVKKYDINSDNYYDLEVSVKSINATAANITVKYLHELKNANVDRPSFNDTVTANLTSNSSSGGIFGSTGLASEPSKIALFIIIAIVVLLIIGFIINRIGKMKSGKDTSDEEGFLNKVRQEIKGKTSKHFAKGKVNVKHP